MTLNEIRRSDIHYFNISPTDHHVLSADSPVIDFIGNNLFTPFELQLVPEDRALFLQKVEICKNTTRSTQKAGRYEASPNDWFPVRLMNRGDEQFYLMFERGEDGKYLHGSMIQAAELIQNYQEKTSLLSSLFGVLSLYDDICYLARPKDNQVILLHKDGDIFKEDVLTYQEFCGKLIDLCPPEEKIVIHSYLSYVEQGRAAFETRIACDMLRKASGTHNTLLKGRTQTGADGELEVYGTIHAERGRGEKAIAQVRDFLTGAYTKEDTIRHAVRQIDELHENGSVIAILDIDYFKSVNDTYGHQKGDEILQKVAGIITNEIGTDGILGRFGGDEFVIIFRAGMDETEIRKCFTAIKGSVRTLFPMLSPKGDGPLTVSIGSARYPADAQNFEDLFKIADYCLYLAKSKGRNRYIIYTPGKHPALDVIRGGKMNEASMPARENKTLADSIVNLMYDSAHGTPMSPEAMLNEIWGHLQVSGVVLCAGKPYHIVYQRYADGAEINPDVQVGAKLLENGFADGIVREFTAINQLSALPESAREIKQYMEENDIQSFVNIRFTDAAGKPCTLMLLSIHQKKQWNQLHFRYYRLLVDILSGCEI